MKAISMMLILGSAVAAVLPAEGTDVAGPAREPGIPQGFSAERYERAWLRNPFHVRADVISQPKVNFARDWALGGMAQYDGKVRVIIVNQQTGELRSLNAGEAVAPADSEIQLVSAEFSRDRSKASVRVRKGGETAILHYQEAKR